MNVDGMIIDKSNINTEDNQQNNPQQENNTNFQQENNDNSQQENNTNFQQENNDNSQQEDNNNLQQEDNNNLQQKDNNNSQQEDNNDLQQQEDNNNSQQQEDNNNSQQQEDNNNSQQEDNNNLQQEDNNNSQKEDNNNSQQEEKNENLEDVYSEDSIFLIKSDQSLISQENSLSSSNLRYTSSTQNMIDRLLPPKDTPHLQADLDAFLEIGKLPSADSRGFLMQYIQRLSLEASLEGNFDEAKKYETINKEYYQACLKSEINHQIGHVSRQLNKQISNAKKKLVNVENNWTQRISQAIIKEQQKFEILRNKQYMELKELDQKWNNENAIKPFSVPSTAIQQALYIEKMAVLGKEYETATNSRKYAQELQEIESRKAQEKVRESALHAKEKLLLKQQKEIIQFEQQSCQRMQVLKKQREREENLAKLHIRKALLSKELNKRPKHAESEILCQMMNLGDAPLGLLSPRSQKKKEQYRKSEDLSRLNVQYVPLKAPLPKRPLRLLTISPQTGTYD